MVRANSFICLLFIYALLAITKKDLIKHLHAVHEQRKTRIFSIDFIRRPYVCPIYLILYLESPTHNKVISIYIFFFPRENHGPNSIIIIIII